MSFSDLYNFCSVFILTLIFQNAKVCSLAVFYMPIINTCLLISAQTVKAEIGYLLKTETLAADLAFCLISERDKTTSLHIHITLWNCPFVSLNSCRSQDYLIQKYSSIDMRTWVKNFKYVIFFFRCTVLLFHLSSANDCICLENT